MKNRRFLSRAVIASCFLLLAIHLVTTVAAYDSIAPTAHLGLTTGAWPTPIYRNCNRSGATTGSPYFLG